MRLFKSKNILAMDFSCGEIKIIEGRYSRKSLSINDCVMVDIPKDVYYGGMIYEMDQLSYLIGNTLKQYDIPAKNTTVVINSSSIITREIIMPKVSHREIKSILEYQISDYIPIEADNYIVQYLITDLFCEDEVEKLRLFLIIIPKEMVEAHLNLIRNMGLNPEVLDFQGNAFAKLIDYNQSINGEHEINNGVIASIELTHDNIRLSLIKGGKIKISRVIEIGIFNIINSASNILKVGERELEKYLQKNFQFGEEEISSENIIINRILKEEWLKVLEEVEMIFRYYLNENIDDSIDLILLHGKFIELNDIEEMFFNFFSISSTKLKDFNNIQFKDELASYANAIGSIIRRNEVDYE